MSRRDRRVSPATLFFALLSLVLAVALYLRTRPTTAPAPAAAPRDTARPARTRATPVPRSSRAPARVDRAEAEPRVAIVIDDLGNEVASSRRIARWKEPVAGAVLPGLSGSAAAARALARGGKEVLLHLPMEPEGYPRVRPGPGVILRSQDDEEIARILEEDLDTVPGAVGVNNHMGSAATADSRVMRAVVRVLARRGLFLLDSRTTEETLAERAAEGASVPAVSRGVFLDRTPTAEAVERSLEELSRRARAEGFAVGIGHPYPATLAVLERELPRMAERGIRLVRVSELARLDRESGTGNR